MKAETTATTNKPFHIQPRPGYVICESLQEEVDKASGIVISDNMKDKDSAGVVLAISDGITEWHGESSSFTQCPVKVGDKIIYSNYGANRYLDFQRTNQNLFIVKYDQIIAIIND